MKRKRRWDESARGQLHMTAIPFLLRILFSPHFPSPISEWLLTDVARCLLPRPFIAAVFMRTPFGRFSAFRNRAKTSKRRSHQF